LRVRVHSQGQGNPLPSVLAQVYWEWRRPFNAEWLELAGEFPRIRLPTKCPVTLGEIGLANRQRT
jgi:hypothetical protein